MPSFVEWIKAENFSINRPLLKLKLVYFTIFSLWLAVFTYVSLISTQIISYNQLAIIHACVPASSILGPVFIGFIADKVGNYKVILMITTLLGGVIYLPILWLQAQHQRDPTLDYIFPVLLITRLLGFLLFDASIAILDSCGLSMSKKHGGDFGRQKMWSMAGMIIVPVICGLVVDCISDYRGFKDYSSVFYIALGLSLAVLPLIHKLDVDVQRNKKSLMKTAKKVMGMADVNAFLIVQVVVGICWGFQRSFFIVYTHAELHTSKTLYGLGVGISGISSMVIYGMAKIIIDKLGAPMACALSLIFTAAKFTSYHFLTNSWMILMTESLDGLAGFLGIVTGNYFCAKAAPPGMLASLTGLLGAAVYGAGRGLGLTVGSLLISSYGIRFAFLILAVLAGSTSVSYMIAYVSCLKRMELARLMAQGTKEMNLESTKNQITTVILNQTCTSQNVNNG